LRLLAFTAVMTASLAALLNGAGFAAAAAQPVAGATYSGTAADGGSVTFTVSSDGTLVDSYEISGVSGMEPNGGTCSFLGEGELGDWPGAPITGEVFSYDIGSSLHFQGSFTGAQAASGTFRFDDPAAGTAPACDTGVVTWSAATAATPPVSGGGAGGGGTGGSGTGGSGTGGGGTGGSGTGGSGSGRTAPPSTRSVTSRVVLRRLAGDRVGGTVQSNALVCRAWRTVFLWRGSKRVRSVRTGARGVYSLAVWRGIRGRPVRATVAERRHAGITCAAGSSTFIRA